ncbi:MAG TPA: tetraacyldisaccharide 4'-kinase [Rudaea sp.]|nr:tetraacyldisaccharide 4'-kinase [Rudaea sp.]
MFNESELRQIWYGGRMAPWVLRALAALYALLAGLRRGLYSAGLLSQTRLPVPVIVVGNINVGGTGKTPLTIALVGALRARGFNPGVVSRGYGGSARGPLLVDANSEPRIAGDEACLIAQATQAPVAVGRDRGSAGSTLLEAARCDVLIADDGLQHYKLCRDVEICVIDGERRFGNGRLLPAGPLREPASRTAAFGFRVCNGGVAHAGEVAMTLRGDDAVALTAPARRRKLSDWLDQRVHAVAGIGNPARFFAGLRAAGIDIVEHAFADHFAYAAADLEFGDDLPVLMTEKDAVKCAGFADARCWRVPVRAELPDDFFDAVAARVRQAS